MQLKTILNHVTDYKSFVIGKVTWQDEELKTTLEIEVKPRANGRRQKPHDQGVQMFPGEMGAAHVMEGSRGGLLGELGMRL